MKINDIAGYDYSPKPNNLKDEKNVREMLQRLEKWNSVLERQGLIRHAKIVENAVLQTVDHNNFAYCSALQNLRSDIDWPVDIIEFIDNPDFLSDAIKVWPKLRDELRIMTPDILAGEPPITEILNRSTIGTGKSEMGKIRVLYDIYFLSCFKEPTALYPGLNRYTKIVFVMQSVRDHITRRVLYEPARQMFLDMPWVRRHLKWDVEKESTLVMDNGIILSPMVASAAHMIGQATIGGHIDEINFMEVVGESKKVAGVAGQGGMYDQADEVYSTLSRRRKSRYKTTGPNPGCLYLSSSLNYDSDFLEKRIHKVRYEMSAEDTKHIHIVDYMQHEVSPDGFSGETFKYLVGTNEVEPRILKDDAKAGVDYPSNARVMDVPIEYKAEFNHDPDKAQRDYLGIASAAINRYITKVHKISEAIELGKVNSLKPLVTNMNTILATEGFPEFIFENMPKDLDTQRFIHVDLSRSGDRCGIAMAKVKGYANIEKNGVVESLPVYTVELCVTVEPDKQNHIDIADVRAWIMRLKTAYSLNIKSVSYDGFDSQESIQQWRKVGMMSLNLSVDKTTEAYDTLKTALYQDRVMLPDNKLMKMEMSQLEIHTRGGKSKIDHPPKLGKDAADAVAGAIFAASLNRVIRNESQVTDTSGNPIMSGRRRTPKKRRSASGRR